MKIRQVASLVVTTLFTAACSVRHVSAPMVPLTGGSIESPGFRSDVELGAVVTGEASASRILFLTGGPSQLAGDAFGSDAFSRARGGAVYNALASSGGDVLIAPRFETTVTRTIFSTTYVVKVTGYSGKVKGVTRAP